MSKIYKVDMKISTKDLTPNSGLLMYQVPVEADPKNPDQIFDPRGFKERNGQEVFAVVVEAAIHNANPKVSRAELMSCRRIVKDVHKAAAGTGEYNANKTDIDSIKSAIDRNTSWPNTDEVCDVLEEIIAKLTNAELINENPTPAAPGSDPK